MTKAFVIHGEDKFQTMDADSLEVDDIGNGQMLFVYQGKQLRGIFQVSEVKSAWLSESKEK